MVSQTFKKGARLQSWALGCANVRKLKYMCAKQFPSVAVKGTKVARYMLKTMKIRGCDVDQLCSLEKAYATKFQALDLCIFHL
jgi:hypothetical protein